MMEIFKLRKLWEYVYGVGILSVFIFKFSVTVSEDFFKWEENDQFVRILMYFSVKSIYINVF